MNPEAAARSWAEERFPGVELQPLRQEASSRRYFRLVGQDMVIQARTRPFLERRDPYLRATELLLNIGVPVPRILDTCGRLGLVLMRDGGDRLLSEAVETSSDNEIRDLYSRAVSLLRRLRRGTGLLSPLFPAAREKLGPARLEWELRFFHHHYLREMRRIEPTAEEEAELFTFYRDLARRVWRDRSPVLTHRDYHSRNILVRKDGGLMVTDHQDARWGPPLYDLASLLRDPYVELPGDLEEEFLTLWERDVVRSRREEVRLAYERTALQRNLKAAGTFACQVMVHGRESFKISLAPTLQKAMGSLRRLPDYAEAAERLGRFVPELPDS